VVALCAVAVAVGVAGLLQFLAPSLAYQIKDRVTEAATGRRGRSYRIALGSAVGSSFRIGSELNRHVAARAGYQFELVRTVAPGNVAALLDASQHIDLAVVSSVDDDAVRASGVYGIAALEPQYFFVIVPNGSPVREVRDLAGLVNPGVRDPGHPATLGERVLAYYGLLTPSSTLPALVTIVRPQRGNLDDFRAGRMVAVTRTQYLRSPLIDELLDTGGYRLVPVRDHEALARSIPGARADVIPAGLYGPGRRIPAAPVPTIGVTQLLVARADVPGRVVRDVLDSLYDPKFVRDGGYAFTEATGRDVGGLPLHPAAAIFYSRNDLVTSDRLGRVSFVGSVLVALWSLAQFTLRWRRAEAARGLRQRVDAELASLAQLRTQIECAQDADTKRALLREADDRLFHAERQVAAGAWDRDVALAVRSLHAVCCRAARDDTAAPAVVPPPPMPPPPCGAAPDDARP